MMTPEPFDPAAGGAGLEQPAEQSSAQAPVQPVPASSVGSKLRADSGTLVLVLLFAAGAGAVYLLSLHPGPAKAAAEQLQVESQVNSALSQRMLMSRGMPFE